MRPRCPGSSTSRLSPKLSIPSSPRSRTNRSPASRSSFAKETPSCIAGNRTLTPWSTRPTSSTGCPTPSSRPPATRSRSGGGRRSGRGGGAERLGGEKRGEDADAVKALRRPSVAAGAINRAVREHGADEVLAAGEALRAAHEALLAGGGEAASGGEAMARERAGVRDFPRLALGEGPSEA